VADSSAVVNPIHSVAGDYRAAGVLGDALPAVAVNKPRVYLAHPFSKKDDVERNFQPLLEAVGLEVLNPFQRPEQETYDKVLAPGGGGLTAKHCAEIVRMDLEKINAADGVVAALVDDNMIGTIMEIFYTAHVTGKPVFAYTPRDRERKHPWIRFYCTVCPDQVALLSNLKQWISERAEDEERVFEIGG
jgi:nucleoside 2-deoxyribosyltransferase